MHDEYDFSKGKQGAVIASTGKTRITIILDDDVIEFFRTQAEAQGSGYQTLINDTLRDAIRSSGNRKEKFQRDLLESVKQMRLGQVGRLTHLKK